MPIYKLIVAYDGTRFHGFQRQIDNATMMDRFETKNAAMRPKKRPHYNVDNGGTRKGCNLTVQEVLEMLLLDLYPGTTVDGICLKFAGRTDKGVHALGQVCVVNLFPADANSVGYDEPVCRCWKLRKDINSRLPVDVSVQEVTYLGDSSEFDPRHDVKRKRYSYSIKYRRSDARIAVVAGPHTIRHAFDPPSIWVCPWSLDDSMLSAHCQKLSGSHNYSNFVHKADRDTKDQNVTIDRIDFEIISTREESISALPDELDGKRASISTAVVTGRFVFEATGFRRTMIRNLVGYCVDICRQLPGIVPIEEIFTPRTDTAAKICAAPAVGLCLESVAY